MDQLIQLGVATDKYEQDRPKAPKPEDVVLQFSEEAVAELNEIISHYPTPKAAMLPALWIAQREYGGVLSAEAMAEVGIRLGRPYAEVTGVATFYSMYNTQHKPGRHKIELCTCLSCHVNGAYRLRDWVKQHLGVSHGETTADGIFTYEEVECLNACDRAPVLQVADAYHGPVNEEQLEALLTELRSQEDSSVIQLADEIVKVHVPVKLDPNLYEAPRKTRAKKAKTDPDTVEPMAE